jgi:hypothetical protein
MAYPIDGSAHVNNSGSLSSLNITLTTTKPGALLLAATINSTSIASITDVTGHSWSRVATTGGADPLEMWIAESSAATSGEVVTVHFAGTATFATLDICGIEDANVGGTLTGVSPDTIASSPSDPNAFVVAETFTFVFSAFRMGTQSTPTQGSGWTKVSGADYQLLQYQQNNPSVASGSATITTGSGDSNAGIVAAVLQKRLSIPDDATTYGLTSKTFDPDLTDSAKFDLSDTGSSGYDWYVRKWANAAGFVSAWTGMTQATGSDVSIGSGGLEILSTPNGLQYVLGSAADNGSGGTVGFTIDGSYVAIFQYYADASGAAGGDHGPIVWTQDTDWLLGNTTDAVERNWIETLVPSPGAIEQSSDVHQWDMSQNPPTQNVITGSIGASSTPDGNRHTVQVSNIIPADNSGVGIFTTKLDGALLRSVSYGAGVGASPAATPSNPNGIFTVGDTHKKVIILASTYPFTLEFLKVYQAAGSSASGAGSASGTGAAAAVGAAIDAAAGSAAGTGSVSGVGAAISKTAGSVSGVGAAAAIGASTAAAVGSAAGVGAAAAIGSSIAAAVGSASGSGAGSAPGASIAASTGSCAGTGSGTAVGSSIAAAVGSASGAGSATGLSPGGAVGAASGAGVASGVGSSIAAAAGASAGSGSASGVGKSTAAAEGSASGSGAASGASTGSVTSAAGSASGQGAASAVGNVIYVAFGRSSGSGVATGVGSSIASGSASASGHGAAAGVAPGGAVASLVIAELRITASLCASAQLRAAIDGTLSIDREAS